MNNISDNDPLISAVLARITGEKIAPRSRNYFILREYGIWLLWIMTVVVGALAVAVTSFAFVYRYFDLHEAIRETVWLYLFEVLPYIWLGTLILVLIIAVYNIRHTNHGYRYSLWILLVGSLIGSIGGGIVLYAFGFGFLIDSELGSYVESYASQEKVERWLWQEPEDGRLLGSLVREEAPEDKYSFLDSADLFWQLDVSELPVEDLELLRSGEPVRLLGHLFSVQPPIFVVCGAWPAVVRQEFNVADLMQRRQALTGRMLTHHLANLNNESRFCPKAISIQRMRGVTP